MEENRAVKKQAPKLRKKYFDSCSRVVQIGRLHRAGFPLTVLFSFPTFFLFRSQLFFGWSVRPGPTLFLIDRRPRTSPDFFLRAVGWAFSGSLPLPKEKLPKSWQRGLVTFKIKSPRRRPAHPMLGPACVCDTPSVLEVLQENNSSKAVVGHDMVQSVCVLCWQSGASGSGYLSELSSMACLHFESFQTSLLCS